MVRDSHFSAATKEYDTGRPRHYTGASQFEIVAVRPHHLFRDEGLLAITLARVNSNLWLSGHTIDSGMRGFSPLHWRESIRICGCLATPLIPGRGPSRPYSGVSQCFFAGGIECATVACFGSKPLLDRLCIIVFGSKFCVFLI